MSELQNLSTEAQILVLALGFIAMNIGGSAYYSLGIGKKLLKLYEIYSDGPLEESEQARLDKLFSSGKRYHNLSLMISGFLLIISTLENVENYISPLGQIPIPKLQTVLVLHFLVIVLLIATERFILLAYPWARYDGRRPPYDWIVMGLHHQKNNHIGFWIFLPIFISSLGASIALKDEIPDNVTFFTFFFAGSVIVLSQKLFYYWGYLISEKRDHRGGLATLSIYLLYCYRVIRQAIYTLIVLYSLLKIVPRWNEYEFEPVLVGLIGFFGVLYIIRWIATIKPVYRWIDKLGARFGFPTETKHY
jgi:hypothetical protein